MSTSAQPTGPDGQTLSAPHLVVENLTASYNKRVAIAGVSLGFPRKSVTALIGPSGCGKSTLLRCLNRVHELEHGASVDGRVLLDGRDIYAADVNPVAIRRRIGMVFQQANVFPTMSILDDVTTALRYSKRDMTRAEKVIEAERVLRLAILWDEVKDKLGNPSAALSGGQQQRLCIARALAVDPELVLMDEPTSSLDPIATMQIEDLMRTLTDRYTIVCVSHNLQQAARVSNYTGFMLAEADHVGCLVEFADTNRLFTKPQDRRTEDYITGRFG
jgi:phosphate transport system ATP-binding protein